MFKVILYLLKNYTIFPESKFELIICADTKLLDMRDGWNSTDQNNLMPESWCPYSIVST